MCLLKDLLRLVWNGDITRLAALRLHIAGAWLDSCLAESVDVSAFGALHATVDAHVRRRVEELLSLPHHLFKRHLLAQLLH